MAVDDVRSAASAVTRVPPVTAGNVALALLGLPLVVLGIDVFDVEVGPVVTIGIYWALALVVVGIAVGAEGLSTTDLGFRRPAWIDLGYVVATAAVILLVYTATDPLVEALGLAVREDTGMAGAGVGAGVLLARAVTVGVVEEILYRGYPIERLFAYADSPLVAGGVTWGVFTLAHAVRWPLGNLLQTALVAAVLTVVYLRRRTLVPVVGAHALVWVLAALETVYA